MKMILPTVYQVAVIVLMLPAVHALKCYECYTTSDTSGCTYYTQCGPEELCGVSKGYLSGHYQLRCFDKMICSSTSREFLEPSIIGRRKRSTEEIRCCNFDYCNKKLSGQFVSTNSMTLPTVTEDYFSRPDTVTSTCNDHSECQILFDHKFNVCGDPETSRLICPRMCGICKESQSTTDRYYDTSSIENGVTMTSNTDGAVTITSETDGSATITLNTDGAATITSNTDGAATITSNTDGAEIMTSNIVWTPTMSTETDSAVPGDVNKSTQESTISSEQAMSSIPMSTGTDLPSGTNCVDDILCKSLLEKSISVCSRKDIAVLICRRTCNRCTQKQMTSPIFTETTMESSPNTAPTRDYTSPASESLPTVDYKDIYSTATKTNTRTDSQCFDKSPNCEILDTTLFICTKEQAVIKIGCVRYCGMCNDVTTPYESSTSTIPTLISTQTLLQETSRDPTEFTQTTRDAAVSTYDSQFTLSSVQTVEGTVDFTSTAPGVTEATSVLSVGTSVTSSEFIVPETTFTHNIITTSDIQTSTSTSPITTRSHSCLPEVPKGGKEYVFMYGKNLLPNYSTLKMLIASNDNCSLIRTDVGDENACIRTTLQSGENIIDIPRQFQMNHDILENKGIHFVSSCEITIHAMFKDPTVTDGFYVLPVNELSTDYVIPSYDPGSSIFNSFMSIAATEPDTNVTIKLKLTGNLIFNGHTYQNGDLLNIHMDKLDTLDLIHDADLTGSQIHSNNKIAVLSGSQCATVPKDTGTCNYLIEMIPPVSSLGNKFIVPPLHSQKDYLVRVIAAHPNTEVYANIDGTIHKESLVQVGDFAEFNIGGRVPIYLNTSEKCLVARYGEGAVSPGEPYLSIILSVNQYKNKYSFVVDDLQDFDHRISIIVPTTKENCLQIDGHDVINNKSKEMYTSYDREFPFSVIELTVTPGLHSVTCNDNSTTFGLTVFGISNENSYGYPASL